MPSRSAVRIREEIETHYGFLPPFFAPAMETPEILENLWQQTLSADIQNPLPELFREKVFTWLSLFCPFPGPVVTHACILHSLGVSGPEIHALLDVPFNDDTLHALAAESGTLERWPAHGSPLEDALVRSTAALFLELPAAEAVQAELRRLLGPGRHPHLLALVAYVKTVHLWTEAHPGMAALPDPRVQEHFDAVIQEEPRLDHLFRNGAPRPQPAVAAAGDERFRRLAESSHDVLYRLRFQPSLGFEYVSASIAEMTGYAPEEFYSDPRLAQKIVHPDDRKLMDSLLRPAGESHPVTLRWLRKDGRVLWTEQTAAPIAGESGEPVAIEGIARDVSEKKWSAERIALLQGVSEAMNDADDVGAALDVVLQRVCRATGWVAGEAWVPRRDGTRLECRQIWSQSPELAKTLWEANQSVSFAPGEGLPGRAWRSETAIWVKDVLAEPEIGRYRIAREMGLRSAAVIPVFAGSEVVAVLTFFQKEAREQDGTIVQLVSTIAAGLGSVIRRKNAEAALRESEERFRSMAESTPNAVIAADGWGRIVSWNPGAEKIFGWAAKEVVGQSVSMLMPERNVAAFGEGLERARETGEGPFLGRTVELAARHKSGREIPVEITLSHWRTAEGVFFGAIIRDITERKRFESQLIKSQRIEGLGQVVRGVAHDFNNVLTALLGNALLMMDRVPPNDPLHEQLVEVQKSAEHAAALTRQLLIFSRKQLSQPEPLDVNEVLQELEPMLARLLGEDIRLAPILTSEVGSIIADRAQLEQVVVNLAVRARESMPDGGRLSIETANVDIEKGGSAEELPAGKYVMLAVTDTGHPMDPITISRFMDSKLSPGEEAEEFGLGMAVVAAIVRQSGGKFLAYSAHGRGNTFKVLWPRIDEAAAMAAAPPRMSARPGGTETVLVAEDDPLVRNVTSETLKRSGYHVLEARTGDEAVRLVREYKYDIDLLVADVVMPGLGGREIAKAVSSRWPNARVLFMSGHIDSVVSRNLPMEGNTAFLRKPFTPDLLARKVREVLDVEVKG